jgi:hypothetical protein
MYLSLHEINSNVLYAPVGFEKQFIQRVKNDKKEMNRIVKYYTQFEYLDDDGIRHQGLYYQLPFGIDNNFTDYKNQEPKIFYKDGLIHIRTFTFLTTEQVQEMVWELDSYLRIQKHRNNFYGYSFEVHKHTINHGKPTKTTLKNYSYRTILF